MTGKVAAALFVSPLDATRNIVLYPSVPLTEGRLPEAFGWRSGMRRLRARANVARAPGSPGAPLGGSMTARQELAEKEPTG
jgi:hypothetical protein